MTWKKKKCYQVIWRGCVRETPPVPSASALPRVKWVRWAAVHGHWWALTESQAALGAPPVLAPPPGLLPAPAARLGFPVGCRLPPQTGGLGGRPVIFCSDPTSLGASTGPGTPQGLSEPLPEE